MKRLITALGLGLISLASASGALAQENAAAPEAPPAAAHDDDFKAMSVEVNPLAISIGRYSAQLEYLPAMHHALVFNPHFEHIPVKLTINGEELDGGTLSGFGAEVGYRFYTGEQGMNGFFVGPSLLVARYSQSSPNADDTSFTSYGGAIDIGGQAVLGSGIVLGAGFGLQYTKVSEELPTDDLNLASAIVAGGGVRPRFLFSVGYAF